jgi:uncharacterized protein (DUF362 family)
MTQKTGRTKPAELAVVVSNPNETPFSLLEAALTESGFWIHLSQARRKAKRKIEEFRILIKPDMGFFKKGSATGTDPVLVEHLIDLLYDRGYRCLTIGEGRDSFDLWLENRDVLVLADLVGYRFSTPEGNSYDVLDLSEDLVEVPFPAESVLHGSRLAKAWVNSDFRICFAKNKTDEENYFALCMHTIAGALPLRDKDYHYHNRLQIEDAVDALLQQTAVHFALIDACVSSHGSAGSRLERSLETHTIIASSNPLLADWVGATKMGLDPFLSPLNASILRRQGLPLNHEIRGDLSPYIGWINVHPIMANSVQSRNQWMEVHRLIKPWLQRVDHELFPFKELLDEQINSLVLKYLGTLDDNPLAWWGTAGLNYWIGATYDGLKAYQTLYAKENLRWKEARLNLNLASYDLIDYENIVEYLEPLADLVRQTPASSNGLRWRFLDASVLFEFSRELAIPYDAFIARVDISKAIQMMNDYIGGRAVPVASDQHGRVTHQAERNLYLPQPNYVVLYNGKVIDVSKLEYIRYKENEQKIFWKTVQSENASAEFDDGFVTFSRTANGETRIEVMGRQLFTLPLFFQVFGLDNNAPLKGFLTEQAYTTFFNQTIANFEAKYEGREIRIGRPWHDQEGEPGVANVEKWPREQLAAFVEKVGASIGQNLDRGTNVWSRQSQPPQRSDGIVDENGFIHFRGNSSPLPETESREPVSTGYPPLPAELGEIFSEFLGGLVAAIQKDFGLGRATEN